MLWPFGKKNKRQPDNSQSLYFKSGRGLFEYQCKYGVTVIEKNIAIVGLVLNAQEKYGAPTPVSRNKDGIQLAALMIASEDGGFMVLAETPSRAGDDLRPDDCVLWVPSIYNQEVGASMSDPRSGWIGFIRAKIEPKIDLKSPSFSIICRYD